MRWGGLRRSTNVQDRRGGRGMMVGGGIGGLVLVVVALVLGVSPGDLMQGNTAAPATESAPASDEMGQFVEAVLGTTEDTWSALFQQSGEDYPEPQLILFSGSVPSACGFAQSAVGPFYCPRDRSVYIDLSFYQELRDRFGAPGDMAQAYVIAHEVGHHVQNITGSLGEPGGGGTGPGSQAVRVELQADCYAGVWAYHVKERNILEPGDIEEALTAAAAIGDDRLQKQTQGQVVPESFTHGTSAQRVRWFRTGYDSGDVRSCDTFRATEL